MAAVPSTRRFPRHPRGSVDALLVGIEDLVADFGGVVASRLARRTGSREDCLRGPFEVLLQGVGDLLGLDVTLLGETHLSALGVRPDYAVDVGGARVGVAELKAPGKGVPDGPVWGPTKHDREQWAKLQGLPNVLYTDGKTWGIYRWGEAVGPHATCTGGTLERAGRHLRPSDDRLASILLEFLRWGPEPPPSMAKFIGNVAKLCRLQRDEVRDTIAAERSAHAAPFFTAHLQDWQQWLFPQLTDDEFADSYAQTVAFGLLLARREGIDFEGIATAAIGEKLAKRHLLVGRALTILTTNQGRKGSVEDRSVVIQTMRRVIGAASWDDIPGQTQSTHLLYERFLESYDPQLRKRSGSYYTPLPVTSFMIRFVDELLRARLGQDRGLAEDGVVLVDPAMGTGSFLLSALERVASTVRAEGGDVPASLRAAMPRLVGFERQIGPYAVAELRLHQTLAGYGTEVDDDDIRFHVTDTLDDPGQEILPSGSVYKPLADSREKANKVKTETRVMVVVGNPPYRERAKSLGAWILAHHPGKSALLDAFRGTEIGRQAYKLHNLSIYFWRWATWKVFESTPETPQGIVAFITTSAYMTGPGFAGMREYLRRTTDEGWIIDLSPEGHQAAVPTRVFPTVQHQVCIGVFLRSSNGNGRRDQPSAQVHYLAVRGTHHEKFARLVELGLADAEWRDCSDEWQAPFTPKPRRFWSACPSLNDLIPWQVPGVKPNRTWVHSPSRDVLLDRWRLLISAAPEDKPALLKETDGRRVNWTQSEVTSVPPIPPLLDETSPEPTIEPIALRSFDRQFLIADPRVVDRMRSDLWRAHSARQVYLSVHGQPVTAGPAIVATDLVPDTHHFAGRGGRALPLYRDTAGTPNLAPGLTDFIAEMLEVPVEPIDLFAYIAAVVGHPAYIHMFRDDLQTPELRIPLTLSPDLWTEAVELGDRIIWLHTYGERSRDPHKGRTVGVPSTRRPRVITPIPHTRDGFPERIGHDPDEEILHVGSGRLHPVSLPVWQYEISGTRVVKKWFSYRKRVPREVRSSDLNEILPDHWTSQQTDALRDLLAILQELVDLEPVQADLLSAICKSPVITVKDLERALIFPLPTATRGPLIVPEEGSTLL